MMKTLMTICLVAVCLFFVVGTTAFANSVTIQFDPDDLVTQASSTPFVTQDPLNRQQQISPKMYRGNNNSLFFGSFYHSAFGLTDNADFFEFRSNNTISIPFFNMFIQGAQDAQTDNWGQGKLLNQNGATASEIFSSITQDPTAPAPTATGTSGWSPYIFDNPYGPDDPHKGTLVGWKNDNFVTDRTNDLLGCGDTNVGNDHGPFTFTITLNETLEVGDTVRLWLGFYGLATPENPEGASGTDYFAWTGDYTTTGGINATSIHAYEGVVYAEVIPEPATIALLGLGSLALIRRRKRA